MTEQNNHPSDASIDETIARILAADDTARSTEASTFTQAEDDAETADANRASARRSVLQGRARELADLGEHTEHDGDQFDLVERRSLRRVEGLSTELEDVTEVEYRQLRLERVVLA